MMRRGLMILGSAMLSVALLLAFFNHSDMAFVVAAAWLAILLIGLIVEGAMRRRHARAKAAADPLAAPDGA
jgi:hypothetical protein